MWIPLLQLSEYHMTIRSRMTWLRELYFDFIYRQLEMENQSITYEQGIQFNPTGETAQSFFVWYIFYQLIMPILDLFNSRCWQMERWENNYFKATYNSRIQIHSKKSPVWCWKVYSIYRSLPPFFLILQHCKARVILHFLRSHTACHKWNLKHYYGNK